jgi:methyltransferase-like protein
MIELDQSYRRNENFVFRRIEDESILVPIKDNVGDMGSIYNLNQMGAFIWELLDGQRKLGAVKEKILEEYEVSPGEAEEDLSEFLTDLIEIEAVRLVDCPG